MSVVALTAVCATAFAFPMYWNVFKTTYNVKKESSLDKANCSVCHVGKTTKLNPYGLDVKAAMATLKVKAVTPDVLKKIENLDSDKDGVKNIVEIKAGTLPGDAKSK